MSYQQQRTNVEGFFGCLSVVVVVVLGLAGIGVAWATVEFVLARLGRR